jgi:tetratricopeptide (TPR) repeat protein
MPPIASNPSGQDPRALWDAAQRSIVERRMDVARTQLHALLETHPGHAGAHTLLAGIVLAEGKVREATVELARAAATLDRDPALLVRVAQGLSRLGEVNAVRASLAHPLTREVRNGAFLTALAHIFHGLGLHAQALELMERARAAGHDAPEANYFHALQLQFTGRLAEAEAEMEAGLRRDRFPGRLPLSLARIRTQTAGANHVAVLRERLATVEPGSEAQAAMEFALYKELEDLGDLDGAWAALQRANAVMAKRLPYDAEAETRLFDAIIARFDASLLAGPAADLAGPTPIFVVGLPRSGTTLLERLLGSHPAIASAGELRDLPLQLRWVADRHGREILDRQLLDDIATLDFGLLGRRYLEQSSWRAHGKPCYVDKLPTNFMLVGLIHRALPHAKVVHITRDPMDVCFSNYRALFGDGHAYSYDLAALAHHHRQYRRLMRHWEHVAPGFVIDVSYADLVRDTEATCRRLLAACGLPFEPAMLDHGGNAASVATLSSAQVRQPIHTRGLGGWERYRDRLEPLRAALGD